MKKIIITGLVLTIFMSSLFAASIASGSPAATVNLTSNKVITRQELNDRVAFYKQNGYPQITEKEVLDAMISDELFMQGAKRDGYYVDDRALDSLYASQKQNIEAQAGQTLTDEEFESLVVSQYGSVSTFKENLRNQAIMSNYLPAVKGDMLENIKQPTDREIQNFYRQNQTNFTQPYMLKVSVITFGRSENETADKDAFKRAQDVSDQIKQGKLSFEKGVQLYSEDEASKPLGGEVGWLVDNQMSRMSVGDEFVETVMDMDVGDISSVIPTPSDYTIAKVTAQNDAKVLKLTDPISPDSTVTVKEYIRQGLLQQNYQYALLSAYESLINDLMSQAKINRMVN